MFLETVKYILKIYFKQNISIIFIFLAIVSTLISLSLSPIDIGDGGDKLSRDASLFFRAFLLNIFAVFFAISHIQREERGNLYLLPMSVGASRFVYFFSSIITHSLILLFISIFFLIGDLLLNKNFINETILAFLSASLLSISILSFGQIFSMLFSVIFAIAIYFLGNGLDELFIYSYKLHVDHNFQVLYEFLARIIPNYYIFENNLNINLFVHYIIWSSIYATFGYFYFSKKALKTIN